MEQVKILVQAACAAAPTLPSRLDRGGGRQWVQSITNFDLLQVSDFLSEHMLRSEIQKYRDELIALRDRGELRGGSDLERDWITSLHLKTSMDLYAHVRTLSQATLKELHEWVRQHSVNGGPPPTNPVQADGNIIAVDLADMAMEVLTQHQLVEFMAKSLA